MDTDSRSYPDTRESGWERVGERLLDYLRTRTSEHWLMFFAGLGIGLLLG